MKKPPPVPAPLRHVPCYKKRAIPPTLKARRVLTAAGLIPGPIRGYYLATPTGPCYRLYDAREATPCTAATPRQQRAADRLRHGDQATLDLCPRCGIATDDLQSAQDAFATEGALPDPMFRIPLCRACRTALRPAYQAQANEGGWIGPSGLSDPAPPPVPHWWTATPYTRADAIAWARGLRERSDWVILDTEAYGRRGRTGREVREIAVLAPNGAVVLATALRPLPFADDWVHLSPTQRQQRAAVPPTLPTFLQIAPVLRTVLAGKTVIAYNAPFDAELLHATCVRYRQDPLPIAAWECALAWHATYAAAGNLPAALGLPGAVHTALGDCRALQRLLITMAGELET